MCCWEQRRRYPIDTMEVMTFAQRKQLVLAAWVATVVVIGIVLAVDNPDLWLVIAAVAIIPSVIANWLWSKPEATLSQLIAAARSRP